MLDCISPIVCHVHNKYLHRNILEHLLVYSVIFWLVSAISEAHEHAYFKRMSTKCKRDSSCGSVKFSSKFSIYRNCQCDPLCSTFGDCCQDSPYYKPSTLPQCVEVGNWNTRDSFKDSYYMVISCPSSWLDKEIQSKCENYINTIREEPIMGHPITSNATNITYANYHCARCNDDLNINTMIRWKFAVACDSELEVPIPNVNSVLQEATYVDEEWFKPKFEGAIYQTCMLLVWRPVHLLRRCHTDMIFSCNDTWRNESVRSQCEEYTSFVYFLEDKPYRNPHCATCNYIPIERLTCYKFDSTPEQNFPILFDFSDPSSNDVGVKMLCQNKNEAYDPSIKKCRNIIWSIAGESGNYESDSCDDNKTVCSILNCSKFVLEPNEYLINDDFTLTYLISGKKYANRKFLIRDDERVEVCANYEVTVQKFSVAMNVVTYIGLGISMGFIVIHLGMFVTNPALQNLSGKNLVSFCIALFVAYGAFISGQILDVSVLSCWITAIIMYYSFMSSFSWMLVMAFDVWRTLRLSTVYLRIVTRGNRWYVFLFYSLIAWVIFPGTLVSTALVTEYLCTWEMEHCPRFGVRNCWFGSRRGLLLFFVIPVGVIMMCNLILFGWSACMICTTTMAPTNKSKSTHRDYRLFARLALLMGLSWTMGFVAEFLHFEPLWYVFIFLNAFQGFLIFIAFTWTPKVRNGLKSQVSTAATKSNSTPPKEDGCCWSWSGSKSVNTQSTTT